jgi:hypothetical protein
MLDPITKQPIQVWEMRKEIAHLKSKIESAGNEQSEIVYRNRLALVEAQLAQRLKELRNG